MDIGLGANFRLEIILLILFVEKKKVIIEIDGGQHNQHEEILYDKSRTDFLVSEGYQVIRFWNNDIDKNLIGVYNKLLEVFEIR